MPEGGCYMTVCNEKCWTERDGDGVYLAWPCWPIERDGDGVYAAWPCWPVERDGDGVYAVWPC